jgi:NAD(P)H-hydrate epimerase
MKVATARQMAELDKTAIQYYGIPALVLMENAGRSCVDRILRILEDKVGAPQEASVAVVCGKGNNGGDGMVIARHLHNRGVYVEVFLLGEIEELSRDARTQAEILRKLDLEVRVIRDTEGVEDLRSYLEEVHLCVDAILGTGISSPLSGIVREVVEVINLSLATVFAVDIPRGIDATTGRILGEAIRADYTGVLGLPKIGNVILPGSIHCGETEIYEIGIPSRAVFEAEIKTETLEEQVVKSMLSVRPPDFHKGDAGRVFVVGGSPGMTGAPASRPCVAAHGGGPCHRGGPASLRPIVEAKQMEVMSVGVPDGGGGHFTPEMIPDLAGRHRAGAISSSSGRGRVTESTPGFLKELLPGSRSPSCSTRTP